MDFRKERRGSASPQLKRNEFNGKPKAFRTSDGEAVEVDERDRILNRRDGWDYFMAALRS